MAQTQVANSESKYAVFLEWCRQQETKVSETVHVFGCLAMLIIWKTCCGQGEKVWIMFCLGHFQLFSLTWLTNVFLLLQPLLATLQLVDVFGSGAQAEAQRSTRGGGASPIDLATVFRWQGECEGTAVVLGWGCLLRWMFVVVGVCWGCLLWWMFVGDVCCGGSLWWWIFVVVDVSYL